MSILGCAQPTVHGSGFAPISIRVNPSEALDGQGLICLPCLLATLTDPLVTGIRKLSILQGIEAWCESSLEFAAQIAPLGPFLIPALLSATLFPQGAEGGGAGVGLPRPDPDLSRSTIATLAALTATHPTALGPILASGLIEVLQDTSLWEPYAPALPFALDLLAALASGHLGGPGQATVTAALGLSGRTPPPSDLTQVLTFALSSTSLPEDLLVHVARFLDAATRAGAAACAVPASTNYEYAEYGHGSGPSSSMHMVGLVSDAPAERSPLLGPLLKEAAAAGARARTAALRCACLGFLATAASDGWLQCPQLAGDRVPWDEPGFWCTWLGDVVAVCRGTLLSAAPDHVARGLELLQCIARDRGPSAADFIAQRDALELVLEHLRVACLHGAQDPCPALRTLAALCGVDLTESDRESEAEASGLLVTSNPTRPLAIARLASGLETLSRLLTRAAAQRDHSTAAGVLALLTQALHRCSCSASTAAGTAALPSPQDSNSPVLPQSVALKLLSAVDALLPCFEGDLPPGPGRAELPPDRMASLVHCTRFLAVLLPHLLRSAPQGQEPVAQTQLGLLGSSGPDAPPPSRTRMRKAAVPGSGAPMPAGTGSATGGNNEAQAQRPASLTGAPGPDHRHVVMCGALLKCLRPLAFLLPRAIAGPTGAGLFALAAASLVLESARALRSFEDAAAAQGHHRTVPAIQWMGALIAVARDFLVPRALPLALRPASALALLSMITDALLCLLASRQLNRNSDRDGLAAGTSDASGSGLALRRAFCSALCDDCEGAAAPGGALFLLLDRLEKVAERQSDLGTLPASVWSLLDILASDSDSARSSVALEAAAHLTGPEHVLRCAAGQCLGLPEELSGLCLALLWRAPPSAPWPWDRYLRATAAAEFIIRMSMMSGREESGGPDSDSVTTRLKLEFALSILMRLEPQSVREILPTERLAPALAHLVGTRLTAADQETLLFLGGALETQPPLFSFLLRLELEDDEGTGAGFDMGRYAGPLPPMPLSTFLYRRLLQFLGRDGGLGIQSMQLSRPDSDSGPARPGPALPLLLDVPSPAHFRLLASLIAAGLNDTHGHPNVIDINIGSGPGPLSSDSGSSPVTLGSALYALDALARMDPVLALSLVAATDVDTLPGLLLRLAGPGELPAASPNLRLGLEPTAAQDHEDGRTRIQCPGLHNQVLVVLALCARLALWTVSDSESPAEGPRSRGGLATGLGRLVHGDAALRASLHLTRRILPLLPGLFPLHPSPSPTRPRPGESESESDQMELASFFSSVNAFVFVAAQPVLNLRPEDARGAQEIGLGVGVVEVDPHTRAALFDLMLGALERVNAATSESGAAWHSTALQTLTLLLETSSRRQCRPQQLPRPHASETECESLSGLFGVVHDAAQDLASEGVRLATAALSHLKSRHMRASSTGSARATGPRDRLEHPGVASAALLCVASALRLLDVSIRTLESLEGPCPAPAPRDGTCDPHGHAPAPAPPPAPPVFLLEIDGWLADWADTSAADDPSLQEPSPLPRLVSAAHAGAFVLETCLRVGTGIHAGPPHGGPSALDLLLPLLAFLRLSNGHLNFPASIWGPSCGAVRALATPWLFDLYKMICSLPDPQSQSLLMQGPNVNPASHSRLHAYAHPSRQPLASPPGKRRRGSEVESGPGLVSVQTAHVVSKALQRELSLALARTHFWGPPEMQRSFGVGALARLQLGSSDLEEVPGRGVAWNMCGGRSTTEFEPPERINVGALLVELVGARM